MDADKKLEGWLYGDEHANSVPLPVELCVDIKNAVAEIRTLRADVVLMRSLSGFVEIKPSCRPLKNPAFATGPFLLTDIKVRE